MASRTIRCRVRLVLLLFAAIDTPRRTARALCQLTSMICCGTSWQGGNDCEEARHV